MLSQEVGTLATSPAAILGPGDLGSPLDWALQLEVVWPVDSCWIDQNMGFFSGTFRVCGERSSFFLAMASSSLTVSHCQGSESTKHQNSIETAMFVGKMMLIHEMLRFFPHCFQLPSHRSGWFVSRPPDHVTGMRKQHGRTFQVRVGQWPWLRDLNWRYLPYIRPISSM